jgi:hypothetical protein
MMVVTNAKGTRTGRYASAVHSFEYRLYYELVRELGFSNKKVLSSYPDRSAFVEKVKVDQPELVAEIGAKIKLGLI